MLILLPALLAVHAPGAATAFPPIALVNRVTFTEARFDNELAGCAFLVRHRGKTFACTCKHALWVAKSDAMKSVHFEGTLKAWHMHRKDDPKQWVKLGRLLNEDRSEAIGPANVQTDWLVFEVLENHANVVPLELRKRPLAAGEPLCTIGWTFKDEKGPQRIYRSRFHRRVGTKLLMEDLDPPCQQGRDQRCPRGRRGRTPRGHHVGLHEGSRDRTLVCLALQHGAPVEAPWLKRHPAPDPVRPLETSQGFTHLPAQSSLFMGMRALLARAGGQGASGSPEGWQAPEEAPRQAPPPCAHRAIPGCLHVRMTAPVHSFKSRRRHRKNPGGPRPDRGPLAETACDHHTSGTRAPAWRRRSRPYGPPSGSGVRLRGALLAGGALRPVPPGARSLGEHVVAPLLEADEAHGRESPLDLANKGRVVVFLSPGMQGDDMGRLQPVDDALGAFADHGRLQQATLLPGLAFPSTMW